MYESESVIE